jgi:hypothetical protein
MVLVIRAGDAIRAQHGSAIDLYANHHELPVLEPEAGIACRREGELCVGPVTDLEHALGTD